MKNNELRKDSLICAIEFMLNGMNEYELSTLVGDIANKRSDLRKQSQITLGYGKPIRSITHEINDQGLEFLDALIKATLQSRTTEE